MTFEEFQTRYNGPLTPEGAEALDKLKKESGLTWKEFAIPFELAGTTLNNLVNNHAGCPRPIGASDATAKKLWAAVEGKAPVRSTPKDPADLSLEDLARIARRKGFRVTFEQLV